MIDKIKANKNLISLLAITVLSFSTWFFNVGEVYNVIFYIGVLILLAIFRAKDITLVVFTLFTVVANRTPTFLKELDRIFNAIFGNNITALRSYYTFLYTAVFIVLLIILFIRAVVRKTELKGKLVLPMIILLIYSLVTLIWAPKIVVGLSEFWFIIQGYFIYTIVRSNEDKPNYYKISWILSLLILVISLQYFVSYHEYFKLKNIDLNFFKYYQFEGKAAINLWSNPNIVAGVFSIAFVPSLYKYFDKGASKLKYLYLPVELLILYAIVLTKSNGLYFALLTGVFFIPFLFIKNKKLLYSLIIAAMVSFSVGITLIVSLEGKYPDFYKWFNEFTTYRLDIYKIAINELKDPLVFLFGQGIGADRIILDYVNFFHSFVFQVLVNRGIFALFVIGYIFYKIIETLFESKTDFRYFLAIGIITYLAHGITDSGFEYQFLGAIFYLLVALLEIDTKDYNKYDQIHMI